MIRGPPIFFKPLPSPSLVTTVNCCPGLCMQRNGSSPKEQPEHSGAKTAEARDVQWYQLWTAGSSPADRTFEGTITFQMPGESDSYRKSVVVK